jgi:hypothetical protein
LEPQVPRRHRHDDVVPQEPGQRRHVVALEGVDVAGEQGLVLGAHRVVEVLEIGRGQRGPGTLEGAVHRSDGGVEQLGGFGGLPLQDLAEDEHGALARRQVLEGSDEGQADRVPHRRHIGRVSIDRYHPSIGDRLDPRLLGAVVEHRRLDPGGRPEVHRTGPALGRPVHVEAHVGGDAVQPRPQRRAALEAVQAAPGGEERLLHRVLGLGSRTQHSVAVGGQLATVVLDGLLDVQTHWGGRHHREATTTV